MLSRFKKVSIGALAFGLLGVSTLGVFVPTPAQAQIPVTVTSDIPQAAESVFDLIWEGIKTASLNATVRMVGYAIRKVSYDSAVWLASGGKGQTPFAEVKSPGEYLLNVGNEAGGAFIEELSRGVGGLCQIPDIKVDLALKVGLRTNFVAPAATGPLGKPACTLSDFKNNWFDGDAWKSKYGADQIGKRFNTTLTTDDSGLGVYTQTSAKLRDRIFSEQYAAQLKREENKGYIAKETIGGRIQTPASLIEEQFKAGTPDKQQAKDQDQLNALLANGDVKVIPAALSLFLNTLVGTMVNNWQEKGVLPFGACVGTFGGEDCNRSGTISSDVANQYFALSGGGGAAVAQSFFNYLKVVNIDKIDNYDILTQFSSCPDTPGTYNCRADDDLILALRQGETGAPVTIREALERGWLHGDWKLISPDDGNGSNKDKECYNKAYCYGNVQVLRQLRILPLGFEIAAKKSSPDQAWTLKQVVDGYNDCPADPGVDDPNKPFCRLIDPNWVLKSFPTRCNALVYGPNLLTNGVPDRLQECADVQTCVAYDASGNCQDYAYCTNEKNTWKFTAQTCEPEFTTCRSFTNSTGQNVAYLFRTLDSQSCSQDNIGCRAYSLTQVNGNWVEPGLNADGTNRGVFFNSKVSTSCSANSAGCSAFNVVGGNGLLNLKKAPDYLGCYDARTTVAGVQWPETQSDLTRLANSASAACSAYSGACVADEVNCNMYTPQNGSAKIPGRFTPAVVTAGAVQWNDQCDAKCVGYAAYREMPTNYSGGESVAYVIPSSGQTCSAQDAGCTAFTNLSATENGGEKVEHFSYLRSCAKPGPNVQSKTYVTYEGSVQGGFQLKTYTLVENTDPLNGPLGAPKYFYKDQAELAMHVASCTEANYSNGTASPDCRQLNDEAGNIYYRLLAQTIPVTEACTAYRMNATELFTNPSIGGAAACEAQKGLFENGVCKLCYQNGEYRNGSCFYEGLPGGITNNAGMSRSCSVAADTCRGYRGNAGTNVEVVVDDSFENTGSGTSVTGWTGGSLSAESTRVGGQSYETNNGIAAVRAVTVAPGQSYDLTFWAKGTNSAVVRFGATGGTLVDVGVVSLSDTWNHYRVGPFEYNEASTSGELYFVNRDGGRIFLDNVRLTRVRDLQYLVKKSLSVDPVCDSNLNDNLPGEALSCEGYKDPTGRDFYLTGFNYLCRENAIGCTAVTETRNTPNETGARAYNVQLSGDGGTTAQVLIGGTTYSCVISVGKQSCFVNMVGHTAQEIRDVVPNGFVSSTVYIPPDSSVASPIFLVANQAATCNAVDLGCTLAGAQQLTPGGLKFVTTTIKNDPVTYDQTLCRSEGVGCSVYSDGSDTQYFKDPQLTGQKVCTYREGVRSTSGVPHDGWFWKGVGRCSDTTEASPTYCTADSECSGGATCAGIGDQACYPTYLNNGEYGVWSSGNAQYQNFVAECPVEQNKCTEFIDRNDNNRAYYFIKDNSISAGDCGGQVSLKFGCAVFDQTDNPNKFFNTNALYTQSENRNGERIAAPTTNSPNNDANIIIKVARDRSCGEWLGCSSSNSVFDSDTGTYKDICENIQRCNGAGCSNVKSSYSGQILTESHYRRRSIGWSGMDYTGFAILGLYPIEELTDINFATSSEAKEDYRLVKKVACGGTNCSLGNADTSTSCQTNGATCGRVNDRGICVNNQCVKNIAGKTPVDTSEVKEQQICRGYPEKDAPFPFISFIKRNEVVYGRANKCNESSSSNTSLEASYACECEYTKVAYGDALTRYWSFENPNSTDGVEVASSTKLDNSSEPKIKNVIPSALCAGGINNGESCSVNEDCAGGICQPNSSESTIIGKRGYCVEYDTRSILYGDPGQQKCLSWFPGRMHGVVDPFNQFVTAGFDAGGRGYDKGPFYCSEVKTWVKHKKYITNVFADYMDCNGELAVSGFKELYEGQEKVMEAFTVLANGFKDKTFVEGKTAATCYSFMENFGYMPRERDDYWNNMSSPENGIFDNEPKCLPGYKFGRIVSLRVSADNYVWNDTEDYVHMNYECVATNPQWESSGDYYPVKPDEYEFREYEDRCEVMFEVEEDGKKSWTERLWKNFTYKDQTFELNTPCIPYEALSLNISPPNPGAVRIADSDDGPCSVGAKTDPEPGKPVMYIGRISPLITEGLEKIKQVFAKSIRKWVLVGSGGRERYESTTAGTWDVAGGDSQLGITPRPPQVLSVGECQMVEGREICLEGAPGITIFANGRFYNGNELVRLPADNPVVSMRFFMFADNNQMPIRRIAVNWDGRDNHQGDNFVSRTPSYFRNMRGAVSGTCNQTTSKCEFPPVFPGGAPGTIEKTCSVNADCQYENLCQYGESNAPFFGLIQDRTCAPAYMQYKNHVYSCIEGETPHRSTCDVPGVNPNDYPKGCCVFKPKVHATDNWGWCTGAGYDDGSGVCGVDRQNSSGNAWLPYGGSVIVAPLAN